MTPEDHKHFDDRFDAIVRNQEAGARVLDSVVETQAASTKVLEKISRGVYGDPDNKTKGLIDIQQDHGIRIESIEEVKKKVLWWAGGAIFVIMGFIELLHWLKS